MNKLLIFILISWFALTCNPDRLVRKATGQIEINLVTSIRSMEEVASTLPDTIKARTVMLSINNQDTENIIMPCRQVFGQKWLSPETVGYLSLTPSGDTLIGQSRLTISYGTEVYDTIVSGSSANYFIEDYYWTEQKEELYFAQFAFPYFLDDNTNKRINIFTNISKNRSDLKIIKIGEIEDKETIDLTSKHSIYCCL